MTETAFVVDGVELARVQHGVPIRQVDLGLVELRTGIFEFREEAARDQIVVILVDLAQCVANGQVVLVIIGKMLFAAGNGDTAIRTFVTDVCGRKIASLADLDIVWAVGLAGGRVVGMGAVGILLDEGSALADDG